MSHLTPTLRVIPGEYVDEPYTSETRFNGLHCCCRRCARFYSASRGELRNLTEVARKLRKIHLTWVHNHSRSSNLAPIKSSKCRLCDIPLSHLTTSLGVTLGNMLMNLIMPKLDSWPAKTASSYVHSFRHNTSV